MCLDNTWSGVCFLWSPLHFSVLSLLLCLASCVCSLPVSYVPCILHILCTHPFRHSPDSECLQRGRGGAGARCWKAVSFLWSSFRKADTQPGGNTPCFFLSSPSASKLALGFSTLLFRSSSSDPPGSATALPLPSELTSGCLHFCSPCDTLF